MLGKEAGQASAVDGAARQRPEGLQQSRRNSGPSPCCGAHTGCDTDGFAHGDSVASVGKAPRNALESGECGGLGLAAFVGYLGFFWESVPVPRTSIAQPRAAQAPAREVAAPVPAVEARAKEADGAVRAGPTDNEALRDRAAPAKAAEAKPLVLAAKPPVILDKLVPPEKKADETPKPVEAKPASQPLPPGSLPAPPQAQPQPPQVARVDERDLARLHNQIEQRLRNQGLLKVSDSDRWGVTIEANGSGVVMLRGALRDQKLRDEAIRVVRDVAGVTDVRTNITLQFAPEGN